jgi:hypothetical protein
MAIGVSSGCRELLGCVHRLLTSLTYKSRPSSELDYGPVFARVYKETNPRSIAPAHGSTEPHVH